MPTYDIRIEHALISLDTLTLREDVALLLRASTSENVGSFHHLENHIPWLQVTFDCCRNRPDLFLADLGALKEPRSTTAYE